MLKLEQERLSDYHAFDDDVLDRVGEVADRQRHGEWQSLVGDLPNPEPFFPKYGKPIQVLDLPPQGDLESTQVYHLPMAIALDESAVMRVQTLWAAQPNTRVIAVGNPGPSSRGLGKLPLSKLGEVWHGDLRPVVDPVLQYLGSQGIVSATRIGFSYGADKAAADAQYAHLYDQRVPFEILMEPASVTERGLWRLIKDFAKADTTLDDIYARAANSPVYSDARELAAEHGHGALGYRASLARPTNLAIGRALSRDGFEGRVESALASQPEMKTRIIWGTESELAIHALMLDLTAKLAEKHVDRVGTLALTNQKHAMAHDIFLHAAMVLQAQKLQ